MFSWNSRLIIFNNLTNVELMKKSIKLIALACTILLPCLSYADFVLSEFAGNYIAYSSSAGGVSDENPHNLSTTSIVQLRLKKNGSGKVNFLSVSNFAGVGSFETMTFSDLVIQYALTNPSIGVGNLVVLNYPVAGSNFQTSFVATKGVPRFNKRGCCVEKLFANTTGSSGDTPFPIRSVSIFVVERQRQ